MEIERRDIFTDIKNIIDLSYQKAQTVSAEFKLSYSHYLTLMRITNIEERNFYEIEAIDICKDKNDTLVNMTLPEGNEQIFASRYMTILPSKEELKKIVESEVRE